MTLRRLKKISGLSYAARAQVLKELGFIDYAEYLRSDLWARIRRRVFEAKGRTCFLCNRYATQVHHNRYSYHVMQGKSLKGLVPLCSDCHKRIEFDQGEKVTKVTLVKREYKRRRRRHVKAEAVQKEARRRAYEIAGHLDRAFARMEF